MTLAYQEAPQEPKHSMPAEAQQIDRQLVELARSGEPNAFEELMKRYERLVFKVAVSFVKDRESGFDLTQTIFFKAFQGLDHLRADSNFKAWLMRIAFNESVNWTRKHKRHQGHRPIDTVAELESSQPSPHTELDLRDQHQQLADGLAHLRPRYRLAISLRYFQGVRVREIAEVLDCSESMAKQLLFRGVRSLRAVVAEAATREPDSDTRIRS